MSKYKPEIRERALKMLQEHGYDATIAEMGIAKDTLYRWKRAAGIKLTAHRKPFELRTVNTESDCASDFEEPVAGRPLSIISDADTAFEEDDFSEEPNSESDINDTTIDDDFALLAAANEKLRRRNAQLRQALIALLEI